MINHLEQISIRQTFKLNGDDHYTIFDLPISVTNSIPDTGNRSSCDELDNKLSSPEMIDEKSANALGIPFAPGNSIKVTYHGVDHGRNSGGAISSPKWTRCTLVLLMMMLLDMFVY